jgi:hypothetical protein
VCKKYVVQFGFWCYGTHMTESVLRYCGI